MCVCAPAVCVFVQSACRPSCALLCPLHPMPVPKRPPLPTSCLSCCRRLRSRSSGSNAQTQLNSGERRFFPQTLPLCVPFSCFALCSVYVLSFCAQSPCMLCRWPFMSAVVSCSHTSTHSNTHAHTPAHAKHTHDRTHTTPLTCTHTHTHTPTGTFVPSDKNSCVSSRRSSPGYVSVCVCVRTCVSTCPSVGVAVFVCLSLS